MVRKTGEKTGILLRDDHPTPVADYTNAFLVSAGFLVFMALFVIWAFWGLVMAALISWGADRLMTVDFRNGNRK